MKKIMIYGATGYSGTLIAQKAKEHGFVIVIAGRDESKLKELAKVTKFNYLAFSLDDSNAIEKAVSDIDIVLNIAGPFIDGLPLLVQICIKCKKHFIDLAMDPNVLASYDHDAKKNGVMILCGIGAAFLPLDCLGGFLFEKMTDAKKIAIYVSGWNTMSRGTAKSNIPLIKYGIHHRKNGALCKVKNMHYQKISFNNRSGIFFPSSFGVPSLSFSTNIPNIETYFEATPAIKQFSFIIKNLSWFFGTPFMQKVLEKRMNGLPSGPTEEERENGNVEYFAVIENNSGSKLSATLKTPEAYETTWLTTLKSLEMVQSHLQPGFQTPYMLFGYDIINKIAGFKLTFHGDIGKA